MMNSSAPPQREDWIDLARFLGAFLVVLAHVVIHPLIMGSGTYWAQTAYFSVTRVAVPLFFMISGYLLLGKQESAGDFFRKRAMKVLIPFLVWSLIYLIFWNGEFADGDFSLPSILHGLLKILRGPRAAHLWFFYALIALYLLTPTLRVFTAHATDRDLLYFCGLWYVVNSILPLIAQYTPIRIGLDFQLVTGYIGYYLLGFYLGRIEPGRGRLLAAGWAFGLGLLTTFTAIYLMSQAPHYDQFFEGYLSFNVVLMTAGAFFLLRAANSRIPEALARAIRPLSRASLGIYLVHVIVLGLFEQYFGPLFPWLQSGLTLYIMPAVAIAAFAVCALIVLILQKIPVLKYSVPW